MSFHEQPPVANINVAATAAMMADYRRYVDYGGRFDFETWWQRYADDYPEVTA